MTDKYSAPSALGSTARRRFHVMAKPSGSTCNLDCTYCYYLSKETLPNGPGTGRMDDRHARALHPAIHRRRHRRGGRLFLAGRRADAARPGVLPQGGRAAEEIRQARPAHRKRSADQRRAPRRGVGGVSQGEPLPGRAQHRRSARAARSLPHQQGRRADLRQGLRGRTAAEKVRASSSTRSPASIASTPRARWTSIAFLRRELDSTYIQFIPIVQIKGFETTAPNTWDSSRLPMLGSPEAGPIIRTRSSPTGRSIPKNTATSCRGFSTNGVARISARSW